MKLTFDIPDSLVPELKAIAMEIKAEGEVIEHEDGSRERITTPADEEVALVNYFRTLIMRGFKKRLVDKDLEQLQIDAQQAVNDKLLAIGITTAGT